MSLCVLNRSQLYVSPHILSLTTINNYIFTINISSIHHYDVIMGAMARQITSLAIIFSSVYSGTDQRKHQSSASLAFVRRIHRWPVNSPHKGPITRKMFPFDDVIMSGITIITGSASRSWYENLSNRDGYFCTNVYSFLSSEQCAGNTVLLYYHEGRKMNATTCNFLVPHPLLLYW